MKLRFLLLFPLLATLCPAEDFTLADGTVLHNARVQRKWVDELQVMHDGGIRKVGFDQLPPELQERFEMTPGQVQARRQAAKAAAEQRREERQAREDERMAQLEAAGRHPRYMDGAAVLRLFSPLETLTAQECEFMAAEWNRREAQRLGLTEQERAYAAEAAALRGGFDAAREVFFAEYRSLQEMRDELAAARRELSVEKARVDTLTRQCNDLRDQNSRLWSNQRSGSETTIVGPPRPIVTPTPVIVTPRPPRPEPPPQPRRHSRLIVNPAPSNNPHTIPRPK